MRRVRIHLLSQRTERDATRLQVSDDRQQMRQRSPKPIEFPHDQRIARTQIIEAVLQARSIVACSRCLISMQITRIDTRRDQSVALKIDSLAIIGR